jgi:hypothetical protein
MTFEQFKTKTEWFYARAKVMLTEGQAYMVYLEDFNAKLYKKIRNTDIDPSYDERKFSNFLLYVEEHWEDEE